MRMLCRICVLAGSAVRVVAGVVVSLSGLGALPLRRPKEHYQKVVATKERCEGSWPCE